MDVVADGLDAQWDKGMRSNFLYGFGSLHVFSIYSFHQVLQLANETPKDMVCTAAGTPSFVRKVEE
jgi:hypothetical protein